MKCTTFIKCAVIAGLLSSVPASAQCQTAEALAQKISSAIHAPTIQEQIPLFRDIHMKYGAHPESTPQVVRDALAEFLYQTAAGKGPEIPSDPMHGRGRSSSELPIKTTLGILDPGTTRAAQAAYALAMNGELSKGLRLKSVSFLERGKHDSMLKSLGDQLTSSKTRDGKAVGLVAYIKMGNVPPEVTSKLYEEVTSPSVGVADTILVNIPREQMRAPLVDLAVQISTATPQHAPLLLPAVAEAAPPEALEKHRDALQRLTEFASIDDKARTAAKRALERAGKK